ncbi:zf-HC2 domain-containing protein [Crenobacter sp. SG2303]|uniref:Zf-HC2 domain-containing protein n=1 Tax=Crenobacter oryzisoli TaxID=3056844 RepID=A0ABT7XR53_9NEIS|nr:MULTISPECIES: zf-HC2 domain-containing protein [unclassified Crenobacter]MDN0076178.1 zf-HC2 domain-containing protein [Crenobacter sp. SG2303]MDN0084789.1 zf-HC2 domain-containing protein [Crenobacter sp. SG2305]
MMIKCKEASWLISASLDRPLTLAEQVRLSMHLLMCGNCKNFSQQMAQLRAIARQVGNGE